MKEWTMDELPENAWDILEAYGFDRSCYAIDFSNVSLEDARALVRFMAKRKDIIVKRRKPQPRDKYTDKYNPQELKL